VSSNDSLFEISTVKSVIMFLWKKYYKRLFRLQLVPFLFYLMFVVLYITFIYERFLDRFSCVDECNVEAIEKWHKFFLSMMFILTVYFILFEILQFTERRLNYFKKAWNYLDLVTYSLVIVYGILVLSEANPINVRPLASLIILCMWIKLLYFLRLFLPTLYMINMIIQVFWDMYTFLVVMALAMLSFANSFYIVSINTLEVEREGLPPEEATELQSFMLGNTFPMALMYSFNQGLGNFLISDYPGKQNEILLWLFFFMEAMLIQVVLLNLLIAIISDTFAQVQARKDVITLKEICNLIYENQFLLDRSKEYNFSKYIIVIKQEQIQASQATTGQNQFTVLKNDIEELINENKNENKRIIDVMRKEMISNHNKLNLKFSQTSDQLYAVEQMLLEIKRSSDRLLAI